MWIGVPVWPFLLAGALLLCRWNPHAGIALALHILAMQGVKILRPEGMDAQTAFFAVYSASAVLTAMFADRVTGGLLAAMALVYLAAMALVYLAGMGGLIPVAAKLLLAEGLFVLALLVGAIGGHTPGFLARGPGHPRPADLGVDMAPDPKGAAPLLAQAEDHPPPTGAMNSG